MIPFFTSPPFQFPTKLNAPIEPVIYLDGLITLPATYTSKLKIYDISILPIS